jgi:hypothetical protein
VNYVPYDFTACAGMTFSVSGCESIDVDDIFTSNDQYLSIWNDTGFLSRADIRFLVFDLISMQIAWLP